MNQLHRMTNIRQLASAAPYLILISACLWIGFSLLLAFSNIPTEFSEYYDPGFLSEWNQIKEPMSRFVYLIWQDWLYLVCTWIIVLGLAFAATHLFNWKENVVFSLFCTVFAGYFMGTKPGLQLEYNLILQFMTAGMILGIMISSLFVSLGNREKSLSGGWITGLIGVFSVFLAIWMIFRLDIAIATAFAFGSSYFPMYYRLPFWLVYQLQSGLSINFIRNPFLYDGVIWFRIFGMRLKLSQMALKHPEEAREFVRFMMRYRPLQKNLAMNIKHAAVSGQWRQNILDPDVFEPPNIPREMTVFRTSGAWRERIKDLQEILLESEYHSNIGLKLDVYYQFLQGLRRLKQMTLNEPSVWNHYYFETIDKWISAAEAQYNVLSYKARMEEPVTRNIYRRGDPLRPELDQDLFVGREDLESRLSNEILTARTMPLFLIQGQRRVGKTSLLNFLPNILGPRFKVVYQDLQHTGHSVSDWFQNLRINVNETLEIEEKKIWSPTEDWIEAWRELRTYLEKVSNELPFKLILAMDEYEALHDYAFEPDRQKAGQLLGAIRSFSQHQNQVVFLFVGSRFFSELSNPSWTEYFPQARTLQIDYLPFEAAIHLISQPNPDFNLHFPLGIPEKIFNLTQGHPALIQMIGYGMVNLANQQNRRHMTKDDLENIIEDEIMNRGNGVLNVFWHQFCRDPKMKDTVRQIIKEEAPEDKASLQLLLEHGFVRKRLEKYEIRVPLFEEWIKRFDVAFL